jgi:hypothetical protein
MLAQDPRGLDLDLRLLSVGHGVVRVEFWHDPLRIATPSLEQVRDFPILTGFPNHANSASPLLIVRWGEDYGTSLQPGFA